MVVMEAGRTTNQAREEITMHADRENSIKERNREDNRKAARNLLRIARNLIDEPDCSDAAIDFALDNIDTAVEHLKEAHR